MGAGVFEFLIEAEAFEFVEEAVHAVLPGRVVATATDMRALGAHLANHMHGGEVILLSGPLGAGKTTFAQGFGAGLGIDEPIVSPTFTIGIVRPPMRAG